MVYVFFMIKYNTRRIRILDCNNTDKKTKDRTKKVNIKEELL